MLWFSGSRICACNGETKGQKVQACNIAVLLQCCIMTHKLLLFLAQLVPNPPGPPGRVSSYPNRTDHSVDPASPPSSVCLSNFNSLMVLELSHMSATKQSPFTDPDDPDDDPPSSKEDSTPSSDNSTDLPPDLLLQAAFIGRSAQMQAPRNDSTGPVPAKTSKLHPLSHKGWKNKGTILLQDVPLWFEWQVCNASYEH